MGWEVPLTDSHSQRFRDTAQDCDTANQGQTRRYEKRGRDGYRKTLGTPEDIRAPRPTSPRPLKLTQVLPDPGEAGKLPAALGQPQVPQAHSSHLGSVRSRRGQGTSLRVPSVRTRRDPGCSSRPSPATERGARAQGGSRRGCSEMGTLARVHAPFRDSG